MAVLRVPDVPNNQFREYYRELISESVRHSTEESREPPHLRSSVRLVWIAALVLLVVDLLAFGVHSWTTSAADIALIVATLVWFWVCVDDLIEFETLVNYVVVKYEDAVICAYDLSKFGGSVVIDALRTHPVVIMGGLLLENPFFVPPDQFLLEIRERRSVRKSTMPPPSVAADRTHRSPEPM